MSDGVEVVELTEEEGAELFARIVRENLGIAAEEFLGAYDRGDYDGWDCAEQPGLVPVMMALPFARGRR